MVGIVVKEFKYDTGFAWHLGLLAFFFFFFFFFKRMTGFGPK